MNVWIVNPFDNLPVEGYRPMRFWLMAEAFRRAGDEVVYWTSDFSHANKKRRVFNPGAAEPPFALEILETLGYSKNVSFRRLRSHKRLAATFARVARAAVSEGRYPAPDLVIASSPPLALVDAVHSFASTVGAKVIVDVMDAWPETFERVVPRMFLWPLRRLAKRNYLRAAAITTVADNYAELVRSYGFRGDIRRFYHGITIKGDCPPAPEGDCPHGQEGTVPMQAEGDCPHRREGTVPMRVVYAGSMGLSYDLKTVLEAVKILSGAVTLDIAGKGEQESSLGEFVAREGIEGVRFHGYLSEEDLARLLASGDVGLVPMDPSSCVGVPYKLADYARASLAVASSLGGESSALLAEYSSGVSYRFGDAAGLAEALRSIAPRLAAMKAASRRMALAEFDAAAIYDRYVAYAKKIVDA